MGLEKLSSVVPELLGPDCISCEISKEELTVEVYSASIVRVLSILKDNPHCQFKVLIDICGVDYPDESPRFKVVYHLLSLEHNKRIRVKLAVSSDTPVPSVTSIFQCANWYEREIWDLYGILFSAHPDLRRILTDYNFEGHPFRKDFPLTGYVEVRYSDDEKRVVYEPVKLAQDFRSFDFLSPWEGMVRPSGDTSIGNLPGDEKASK